MTQDPSKPTLLVAGKDVGKAAATVLANWQKHANKTYALVSTRHSVSDAVKAISEVVGREVKNVQLSYDTTEQAKLQDGPRPFSVVVKAVKAQRRKTGWLRETTSQECPCL